ncbi:hypothetical protein AK812_SmicGene31901 [Symbiodinium microadriaticum]|uniref:Secreted protein n=1 Tax=Symbiodinium microadriaticum TaxID=2951 RepID=A0A1Q9CVK4_SYMMI|nr:hypothetical protein AK812_SmicGene31901 [Symbiodinium microadriaticum]
MTSPFAAALAVLPCVAGVSSWELEFLIKPIREACEMKRAFFLGKVTSRFVESFWATTPNDVARCIRGKDVLIQRELSDCRPTTDGRHSGADLGGVDIPGMPAKSLCNGPARHGYARVRLAPGVRALREEGDGPVCRNMPPFHGDVMMPLWGRCLQSYESFVAAQKHSRSLVRIKMEVRDLGKHS